MKVQKTPIMTSKVLDHICDRVAAVAGYGHIAWDCGPQEVAVPEIADALGITHREVEAEIRRLDKTGLLATRCYSDDDYEIEAKDRIVLVHESWLKYSKRDDGKLEQSLDDWLNWDGIDGTCIGGQGEEKTWKYKLGDKIVAHYWDHCSVIPVDEFNKYLAELSLKDHAPVWGDGHYGFFLHGLKREFAQGNGSHVAFRNVRGGMERELVAVAVVEYRGKTGLWLKTVKAPKSANVSTESPDSQESEDANADTC